MRTAWKCRGLGAWPVSAERAALARGRGRGMNVRI